MRFSLILAALLAAASAAEAQTLAEAMTQAEATNPVLAAQRQRLRATKEALPQAWSEALPQLSLSANATTSDSYGPGSVGDRRESWSGGVTASQLLFASGSVLASTRSARARIAGALADFEDARQQLYLDVADSYATMRQVQAIVSAQETTASNLEVQQRFVAAQFEAGVVTRTDVAQADARLAQARTQLVQAQGQLAAANEAFLRLVGAPPSDLTAPEEATGLPESLDAALSRAVANNPALIAIEAAAQQADADLDVARAAGRLRVSLTADAGKAGDFDQDDSEFSSDSVGVRVSLPLFTGGLNWSRTRQQRALRSAADLDVAAAQRSTRELVTNSWTGLQSARAAVASARDQVSASELAYEGIRLEQETGLRTTIDVLNQEQDLLTARLALAQAERDLVVAERQLLAAVGDLAPPEPDTKPRFGLRGREDD
jgi:outer membrane protein